MILYASAKKNKKIAPFHPPSLNPMVDIIVNFTIILYGLQLLRLWDLWTTIIQFSILLITFRNLQT